MPLECSICLMGYKDPVSLPCGHIYCHTCLIDHVNAPTSSGVDDSKCPECRRDFPITIPDLTLLHKKYHPFISHSVRRVYLDLGAHTVLQKRLKRTEKALDEKKKGEQDLLRKCEALEAGLNAHRYGEADANEQLSELEERYDELEESSNKTIKELEDRIRLMGIENKTLKLECKSLSVKNQANEKKIAELEKEALLRNTLLEEAGFLAPVEQVEWQSPALPPRRKIKSLPRRRAALIHTRDDSDSPPPSFKRVRRGDR